jgi:hypothetical protein
MVGNGRVIRTIRYEQNRTHCKSLFSANTCLASTKIYTVLNIYQINENEHEAVLRMGPAEGTCNGPTGLELRYPLGNESATELCIAQFKGYHQSIHSLL